MRTRLVLTFAVFLASESSAWATVGGDKDNYRFVLKGDWWFIHPKGDFGARNSNNYINFNEDLHFCEYSTFTGRIDWRFFSPRRQSDFLEQ